MGISGRIYYIIEPDSVISFSAKVTRYMKKTIIYGFLLAEIIHSVQQLVKIYRKTIERKEKLGAG